MDNMSDADLIEDAEAIALDDSDDALSDDAPLSGVLGHITSAMRRAEDSKLNDEGRALQAYRNYRGIYGPDVQFTDTEKCQVFVKITKTKVLAAYQQIIDVLFSNQKFPLTIEPTLVPENVADAVHFDPQNPDKGDEEEETSPFGYAGDGNEMLAGASIHNIKDRLGPLTSKLKDIMGLKEGAGATPTSMTMFPAKIAAKKMEKKIHDQLEEGSVSKHLRSTAFECSLFGTGIMQGPFAEDKEYANWSEAGEYTPIFKVMPKTENVSFWDAYPDPDARSTEELTYFIRRRKMSRNKLRALKKRPHFRKEVIEQVILMGEEYEKKYWEDDLSDYSNTSPVNRFEVLEYWGYIDKETAEDEGMEIPEQFDNVDELQVNVWVCQGHILRFVLNPFKPARIPFMIVPYELNPYSIFGVGVGENMDDTQTLMNGFMRMAVDNAVLSGNLLIEIDETNLVPGQDLDVYPGKVFRRQGGAPGQAIFGTKYPNISNENMQMFDKARQLADESTSLPSYSHGQTGVSGTGRTAAGISMLMDAAAGSIKSVVKNFDDYLLRPLGEGYFSFNMQFDFDKEMLGDLEVKARGTESLMANEVRSQRLTAFLQTSASPVLAPYVNAPYIIQELAKSMQLDSDKVTNTPEEAARIMALQQQNNPQPPQGAAPPPGANPVDMTGAGGGNIGVGGVPTPGMDQFSGNVNAPPQGNSPAPQAAGNEQAPS
tara:strand:+ start:3450 stop:5585 length:2136 start_codon:yes stop_codon:yes gene_type:complete